MTRINSAAASLLVLSGLTRTRQELDQTFTRLATGLRLNAGRDDPAGLIASENLRSEIAALEAELQGNQQVGRLLNVADSALAQISPVLDEVQGLLISAANTGVVSDEEAQFQREAIASALESIDRLTGSTRAGGQGLFESPLSLGLSPADDTVLTNLRATLASAGTSVTQALDVNDLASAMQVVQQAQAAVGEARARVGAIQKYAVQTRTHVAESELQQRLSARSDVADADFAQETSRLTRLTILQRSGIGVLAQADKGRRAVLALLEA